MLMDAPLNFGTFPLSTEGVPEVDRVAVWREEIAPMMRLDVEALPETPFQAELTMRVLPGLAFISGTHSPFRVARTRALVADGNDDLVLLMRTGTGILLRRGHEVSVSAGDTIMLSNGDVGGFTFASAARVAALTLPRAVLKPLLCDADAALRHPLPNDSDALRLLQSYLAVMGDDRALANQDLSRTVVTHVHDLVALALGAGRDAAARADERSVPAARLRAIKTDIADSLDREREVSVGALATRHKVTPRYVQMLFEREGTTLTQFVLGHRLARAHRMLVNPSLSDRGIATIAFAAGFGDLSYFIRAFRRIYGATPSEVRAGVKKA